MPDLDLQSKPEHICVLRLSAIGDTCHALAVIRRIDASLGEHAMEAMMSFATAFGTTVIGLYATSNPDQTGPYLSITFTINRYPDAIKRYLNKNVAELAWGQRVRETDAMDLIGVDETLQKVDDFFDDRDI